VIETDVLTCMKCGSMMVWSASRILARCLNCGTEREPTEEETARVTRMRSLAKADPLAAYKRVAEAARAHLGPPDASWCGTCETTIGNGCVEHEPGCTWEALRAALAELPEGT
jgi:DNA-directed RNA polymerase subunit M/transcription elongation factor TFIIS